MINLETKLDQDNLSFTDNTTNFIDIICDGDQRGSRNGTENPH